MTTESKKLQCNRLRVGHITTFIFDDGEFFCAHTDMPGVRVGMNNINAFNIPRGHAFYDRAVEADTRTLVEALFDELMDAFDGEGD